MADKIIKLQLTSNQQPATRNFFFIVSRGKSKQACHPIELNKKNTIMKTIDFKKAWIGMLFLPLLITSCDEDIFPGITGEGNIITETLMLDDFTGFINASSADIYITQGDVQEVVIEAQENIIDNLEVDVNDDGYWKIKYDRWVRRAKPVKIYITVPDLDKVVVDGSGGVFGETAFDGLGNLELIISGSGSMDLEFTSETLELVISGSGSFDLSGESQEMDAVISGSGDVRAFDLATERAEFRISGSGSGHLSVSDHLKAMISGSGDIYYRGTPEMDIHISGSGSVSRY